MPTDGNDCHFDVEHIGGQLTFNCSAAESTKLVFFSACCTLQKNLPNGFKCQRVEADAFAHLYSEVTILFPPTFLLISIGTGIILFPERNNLKVKKGYFLGWIYYINPEHGIQDFLKFWNHADKKQN